MDVEEVRDRLSPDAVSRIDFALSRASAFLRATVSELRPVVLEQWDLPDAMRQLAQTVATGRGLPIAVDSVGWPPGVRTSVDGLLFCTARELLSHILTAAGAARVSVSLKLLGMQASLQLRTDGTGIGRGDLQSEIMTSGTGLASHRVRVEAAGGTIDCAPAQTTGTVVTVLVPAVLVSQVSKARG